MVTFPGHHIPGTPAQWGAALANKIGLPVRRASAKPRSSVANHWMAGGDFIGEAPLTAGTACAFAGVEEYANHAKAKAVNTAFLISSPLQTQMKYQATLTYLP
jgi:hypothetical protein